MDFDDNASFAAHRSKTIKDAETAALEASYVHVTSHITEFAKLQYQLVAIAYALAGAILTFLGNGTPNPRLILFFPPIFCGIVLIQLYLHSNIKAYGRYVNFWLRPRMQTIINMGRPITEEPHTIWDWEDYYAGEKLKQPSGLMAQIIRFFPRRFGSLIILLPLVPAVITITWYLSFSIRLANATECIRLPFSDISIPTTGNVDCVLLVADGFIVLLTLFMYFAVYKINAAAWYRERKAIVEYEKKQLRKLFENLMDSGDTTSARIVLMRLIRLDSNDASARQLLETLEAGE